MPGDDTPYRRTYGRVLVAISVFAVPLYLILPENAPGAFSVIRQFIVVFGMSVAALWCPVLAYAGVRTSNKIDMLVGCIGASTLIFWVPLLLK